MGFQSIQNICQRKRPGHGPGSQSRNRTAAAPALVGMRGNERKHLAIINERLGWKDPVVNGALCRQGEVSACIVLLSVQWKPPVCRAVGCSGLQWAAAKGPFRLRSSHSDSFCLIPPHLAAAKSNLQGHDGLPLYSMKRGSFLLMLIPKLQIRMHEEECLQSYLLVL